MATVILLLLCGSVVLVGMMVLALTFWSWKQEKQAAKKDLETQKIEG